MQHLKINKSQKSTCRITQFYIVQLQPKLKILYLLMGTGIGSKTKMSSKAKFRVVVTFGGY